MAEGEEFERYAFHPIQFQGLINYYYTLRDLQWTPKELDYRSDRNDWDNRVDAPTKEYVKFILFLFAQLDGLINANLVERFKKDTSKYKECSAFYSAQEYNETIHNETYSLLIQTLITDPDEQRKGLNAIAHYPEIRKIADWALRWMQSDRPLLERLVAFACIEGIIFTSAFAGIYWIKRMNILQCVTKANEWIARDEAIHTEWAVALLHTLVDITHEEKALSKETVYEIVGSAVDVASEFTRSAMRLELVGLDADEMIQYIQCTADRLIASIGFEEKYKVTNPFEWMVVIALPNKTNFFESKVSEYAKQIQSDIDYEDKMIWF